MEERRNKRGFPENYVKYRHLTLDGLKQEARGFGLSNGYLFRDDIPESPRPEFQVVRLKHETGADGLRGIRGDGGFRGGPLDPRDPRRGSVVWWSLALGPEEIRSAETRFLERTFPERTEEQAAQQHSFLEKFTTSPAFENTSRLGPYRFTLRLEEVLRAYRTQCCGGERPTMRIYETVLYKQEVMHVVLVHSPANQEDFSEYPLLPEDDPNAICAFRDGRFIWRPEAMSGTHRHQLIYRRDNNQTEVEEVRHRPPFYVWDHFTIALHVGANQLLQFDDDQLRKSLKYCPRAKVSFATEPHDSPEVAEELINSLWPDDGPSGEGPIGGGPSGEGPPRGGPIGGGPIGGGPDN